jgi:hypothetical protein
MGKMLMRAVFDLEKEAGGVCRGCMSLWILNQSLLIIRKANYLSKEPLRSSRMAFGCELAELGLQ